MSEHTDEMFAMYNAIVERRSRKIKACNESVMKQALKAFGELLGVKKQLVGKESTR